MNFSSNRGKRTLTLSAREHRIIADFRDLTQELTGLIPGTHPLAKTVASGCVSASALAGIEGTIDLSEISNGKPVAELSKATA